jgi:hypothetical protein
LRPQPVDQFVWVSGLPLGPLTRFYLALLSSTDDYFILLSKAPSLTKKLVCSLQCNHSLVRLLTPNNHTLPSDLRLCSLFVASYDSQGLRWKYSNPPEYRGGSANLLKLYIFIRISSFLFSLLDSCLLHSSYIAIQ